MTAIHPKTWTGASGAGLGGSLAIVLVWILSLCGVQVPDAVGQALATIMAVVVGFIASYLAPSEPTPPSPV